MGVCLHQLAQRPQAHNFQGEFDLLSKQRLPTESQCNKSAAIPKIGIYPTCSHQNCCMCQESLRIKMNVMKIVVIQSLQAVEISISGHMAVYEVWSNFPLFEQSKYIDNGWQQEEFPSESDLQWEKVSLMRICLGKILEQRHEKPPEGAHFASTVPFLSENSLALWKQIIPVNLKNVLVMWESKVLSNEKKKNHSFFLFVFFTY